MEIRQIRQKQESETTDSKLAEVISKLNILIREHNRKELKESYANNI